VTVRVLSNDGLSAAPTTTAATTTYRAGDKKWWIRSLWGLSSMMDLPEPEPLFLGDVKDLPCRDLVLLGDRLLVGHALVCYTVESLWTLVWLANVPGLAKF
jgi:hypothetical protein